MTNYKVHKSTLKGKIAIPPSKSHTFRAILFGLLGDGKTIIHNYLRSPDTDAIISACRSFGAVVNDLSNCLEIEGLKGQLHQANDVIYVGNSGIALRFCAAISSLAALPIIITGDHSIRSQRPMQPLLEGLSQLSVSAVSSRGNGFAPVIIQGPLKSGKTTISGEDSQPVSAMLIAGAFAQGPIDITVKNPGEKPWVGLTLAWFDRLGIPYENHHFEYYRLQGKAQYKGFEYTVPGDFSSAAFPIAAAIITGSDLTLTNIDFSDVQGDKEIITIFREMGALIEVDEMGHTLHIKKGGSLHGITIDINHCIDTITILAVVACFAEGETHIHNAAIARHKECDRIHCIAKELKKMGADITETEDGLIIKKSLLIGAEVNSYDDHRMAMSLAIAGLSAEGETIITSVECVTKTFPSFMQNFQALGAHIQ